MNVIENFINGKYGINIKREQLFDIQKLTPIFEDLHIAASGSFSYADILHRLEAFYYGGWEIIFIDDKINTSTKNINAYKDKSADAFGRTHGIYSLHYFISSAEKELNKINQINIQECEIIDMLE